MAARAGRLDIKKPEHLAHRLDIPLPVLRTLAEEAASHSSVRELLVGKKVRPLDSADPPLKQVHDRIKTRLLDRILPTRSAHAYVKGRDSITCAKPHVGRRCMLVVDIQDYYPSLGHRRIYRIFMDLGCSPDVARILTLLTTTRHRLPQGFKTSNALSNLFLRPIDRWLERQCDAQRLAYTRYCDNLYVSGGYHARELLPRIARNLSGLGLRPNPSKTRFMCATDQRIVCGLVVNHHLNVPDEYYRATRAQLDRFSKTARAAYDPRTVRTTIRSLRGKISYIRRVNARRGERLLSEFQRACHALDGTGTTAP